MCFVPLICVFVRCSFFCNTVPFFPQWNIKTEHCVFVSMFPSFVLLFRFLSLFPFFIRNNGTKMEQCFCTTVPCFCTTVPCFCTTVPFWGTAVLFFHTKQWNKNGTVCFCTTVPFLHYCSVFVQRAVFFHRFCHRTTEQK